MSPTRRPVGTSLTNVWAALWAAAMRLGCTSVAIIDPETSITSITVACSWATCAVTVGRATANTSAPSARRYTNGGTWRRTFGDRATTLASKSTLVNRAAYFARRRWAITYISTSTGNASSSHSALRDWNVSASTTTARSSPPTPSPVLAPQQECGEGAQPVARRAQYDMVGAARGQRLRDFRPFGRSRRREPLAHPPPSRVDPDLAAG